MECKQCGGPIPEWSGKGRPRKTYCSTRCKNATHDAERRAKVMAARAGRRCVRCGEPISIERTMRATCCSSTCQVAWQNEKRSREQFAKVLAIRQPCARCGEVIPDDRRRGSTTYCSSQCKNNAAQDRWRVRSSAYNRKTKYGVTSDQFETLRTAQGDRCAICRGEWRGKGGQPHVDHDHTTGAVRGLLCGPCNNGLGMFRDDPALLRAAADYLGR